MGGRLDTIQAAVLNIKLKYYEKDLKLRQDVFRHKKKNKKNIETPFRKMIEHQLGHNTQ